MAVLSSVALPGFSYKVDVAESDRITEASFATTANESMDLALDLWKQLYWPTFRVIERRLARFGITGEVATIAIYR